MTCTLGRAGAPEYVYYPLHNPTIQGQWYGVCSDQNTIAGMHCSKERAILRNRKCHNMVGINILVKDGGNGEGIDIIMYLDIKI